MTDQTPSEQTQRITVHDDFQPGDVVLLQHTDGPEFSTVAESVVTKPAMSVTFASVEPRIHWHVTIRRAPQPEDRRDD